MRLQVRAYETMTPRHTARAIVLHDDQVLLMERWRDGLHYFSIPGGGIEFEETPEITVVREIAEETSLVIEAGHPVLIMMHGPVKHTIFLSDYLSGEPQLPPDSPEAGEDPAANRFEPRWVAVDELEQLDFGYWNPVKAALLYGLQSGFTEQPVIVTVA